MSKDTFMQNFKPLGLVDVSGDILGFTFWLRSFNYEDSCKINLKSMVQFHGDKSSMKRKLHRKAASLFVQTCFLFNNKIF